MCMKLSKHVQGNKGFTLIELLLVVGIIGVLLAIIVPKAIRANIDAKYGIVDKNCAELKSFGAQWAEKSIRAQDDQQSTATLADYYSSLAGQPAAVAAGGQQWIATNAANNWNFTNATAVPPTMTFIPLTNRFQDTGGGIAGGQPPEDVVESLIPPEKALRNPFNGVNVFRAPNDPAQQGLVVTGAIAMGYLQDTQGFYYFALAYQGTDSTAFALPTANVSADDATFHAGSGLASIPTLKNAQLFARVR